jgi:hypothetical protein
VVLSGWVQIVFDALGLAASNISFLRLLKTLRPLRTLTGLGLQNVVSCLFLSIPPLGNVIALLFFMFFVFGSAGVLIWGSTGALHGRCRLLPFPIKLPAIPDAELSPLLWVAGAGLRRNGLSAAEGGTPDETELLLQLLGPYLHMGAGGGAPTAAAAAAAAAHSTAALTSSYDTGGTANSSMFANLTSSSTNTSASSTSSGTTGAAAAAAAAAVLQTQHFAQLARMQTQSELLGYLFAAHAHLRCIPAANDDVSVEHASHSPWHTPHRCWWPIDRSVEGLCSLAQPFNNPACAIGGVGGYCGSNYDRFGNMRFEHEQV